MNLFFATPSETVKTVCLSLSHFEYTVKALKVAGDRHSLAVASEVMQNGGKIFFSTSGHKFRPCPYRYTRDSEDGRQTYQFSGNDPRIIAEPDQLWRIVNLEPFETPMMADWREPICLALQRFVKPLQGHEPLGAYLDQSLSPEALDDVVCGLVKRKILLF